MKQDIDLSKFVPIKGLEKYLISPDGEVYSYVSNRLLTSYTSEERYGTAIIYIDKHRYCVYKLVADAFLPNPHNYKRIIHKDGNKLNNSVSNLKWVDTYYNRVIRSGVKNKHYFCPDVNSKPIEGVQGNYTISQDGKVFSLTQGKYMKEFQTVNFGKYVSLSDNRKNKKYYIDYLVATAFVYNPHNYIHIRHKDGNILNNNADNLEWYNIDLSSFVPIKGHEEYLISKQGKIYSTIRNRFLNPHFSSKGYHTVSIADKEMFVHQLVALTYIDNPHHYKQINHKDENKINNCVENLEWCDGKYNSNYGTRNQRIAQSNRLSKKRPRRKVVCIDYINNKVTIFPSIASTKESGYTECWVGKACRNHTLYRQCHFMYYEDFMKGESI